MELDGLMDPVQRFVSIRDAMRSAALAFLSRGKPDQVTFKEPLTTLPSASTAETADFSDTEDTLVAPTPPLVDTDADGQMHVANLFALMLPNTPAAPAPSAVVLAPPRRIDVRATSTAITLLESALAEGDARAPNHELQLRLYADALRYLARGVPSDSPGMSQLAAEIYEAMTDEDLATRPRRADRPESVCYRMTRAFLVIGCNSARGAVRTALDVEKKLHLWQKASRCMVRVSAAGYSVSYLTASTVGRLGDHWVGRPMRDMGMYVLEEILAGLKDGIQDVRGQAA